jgi:alpha/beta superfamily hydrolase
MTRSNSQPSINQMGVDTSTISMTVTASAYCHKFQFNGGNSCISAKPVQSESITYTLNTTPSNMTAVPLDASVTWEQLPRNQKITIQESNQRFFIERQITVTGTVRDRVNRR